MSCIAGVGGDVGPLVRIARSGRPILAIDGCSLRCAAQCLARQDVTPTVHLVLTDEGVKKRFHKDFDQSESAVVYQRAIAALRTIKAEPEADRSADSPEMAHA